MPHSPYHATICQPFTDGVINDYKQQVVRARMEMEEGENDKDREDMLADAAEAFVEYFEFLKTKLNIKKRECGQLDKQNETLEKENEALKEESSAQKSEIATLRSELETARAATVTEEQLGSNGDGTLVQANSHELNSEDREAEKPEEGKGSVETTGKAKSRKRGAEVEAAVDGKAAVKKGKTGKEVDKV